MKNEIREMTAEEVVEVATAKRAGAFMYVEYERDVPIAQKYAELGKITATLSMTGRTGCEYSHTKEAIQREKERGDAEKRPYSGPKAIVRNRFYEGREGMLFRFYPVSVRTQYFLNGKPVRKEELEAKLPKSTFSKPTGIMNLSVSKIKRIK